MIDMNKTHKILVLCGGTSSERAVSLRSGAAVRAALEQAGHQVTVMDPADTLTNDDFEGYDAIFPVLHGAGGEDGVLQGLLESLGYQNFVGSDALSSALCFDKWRHKQLLDDNHVKNPAGAIVTAAELVNHPLTEAPFVLKPVDGGSSVDTFIVRDVATADMEAMQASCEKNSRMLIEELIEGTEITVGVLGNESLPVIEIIPPADGEFDYENKYNGKSQELCPPQSVAADVQTAAQELALRVHTLSGCRDFSRTDMIITADNSLYVLETNTIPGMTDQSLLPKAAAVAGLSMPELVDRLVNLAAARA